MQQLFRGISRGVIFKSESLNIVINFYRGENGSYVLVEKGSVRKVDLKDLGLFGQLWPQFWGRGGNVELISERITDTSCKWGFSFFLNIRNRILIKMFWYILRTSN